MRKSLVPGRVLAIVPAVLPVALLLLASPAESPISGRILEACSCAIPCPCNFGQRPSPHDYCEYLAIFEFTGGEFHGAQLKGLRLAIASDRAIHSTVFIDSKVSAGERDALTRISRWILSMEGKEVTNVVVTPIELSFQEGRLSGSLPDANATLVARPLIGNDGKPGLVVSRPFLFGDFPVIQSRKAMAIGLNVRSAVVSFDYNQTNANDALFQFWPSQVR